MATVSESDQATSAEPDAPATEPKATVESPKATAIIAMPSAKKTKPKPAKRRTPARKSKPAAIKPKLAAKKSKPATKKRKATPAKSKPSTAKHKPATKKAKPVTAKHKPSKTKAAAISHKRTAKKPKATTAKSAKSVKVSNGSVNKAEEIRRAAKEIGGKKVRPKAVIELLASRGIEVSSPQVSSTLKAAGYRRIRHRKTVAPAPDSHATSAPAGLSLEHLMAAKVLLGKAGSLAAARKAIEAMARLS